MEALRNKPLGYKSWSELSPPSIPDNFGNSMKNSLGYASEREAFITVIFSLITDNQTLKTENSLLRSKILMQHANPTSKEHELQEAQQERSRKRSKGTDQFSRSAMSACKLFNYCRQVHRYGISFCKAYGAICSYCRQINHVEEACFFKHPHLGKFKNTRSRKISKLRKLQAHSQHLQA